MGARTSVEGSGGSTSPQPYLGAVEGRRYAREQDLHNNRRDSVRDPVLSSDSDSDSDLVRGSDDSVRDSDDSSRGQRRPRRPPTAAAAAAAGGGDGRVAMERPRDPRPLPRSRQYPPRASRSSVIAGRALGTSPAAASGPRPSSSVAMGLLLPRQHLHPLASSPQPRPSRPNQSSSHLRRRSSYDRRGGRGGGETQAAVRNDGPLGSPRFDIALLRALIRTGQDALILSRRRRSSTTTRGRRSKRDYRSSGRRREHASVQDDHDNDHGASDWRKRRDSAKRGSTSSSEFIRRVALLSPFAVAVLLFFLPRCLEYVTRPSPWAWAPVRRLNSRRCAMNYFIEKQPPDEYDPDAGPLPGEKPPKDPITGEALPNVPRSLEGTYRTKGQVFVLLRFIEAVADSFRSSGGDVDASRQHVVFTNSRDGGHLAEVASAHWPPRGRHRTMFHVVADEEADDDEEGALGYGTTGAIEERFKGSKFVSVYGTDGMAGLDADDDEVEWGFGGEGRGSSGQEWSPDEEEDGDDTEGDDALVPKGRYGNNTAPYPDLVALLRLYDNDEDEEDDDETDHRPPSISIPYLHIDGRTPASQFRVLRSVRALLLSNTVGAVGLEHSPGLSFPDVVEFFRLAGYKTFLLGSRQLARLDHLCEETLREVLDHPHLARGEGANGEEGGGSSSKAGLGGLRSFLRRWGIINPPLVTPDPGGPSSSASKRRRAEALEGPITGGGPSTYPPFLVALPKGRRTSDGTHFGRQEMTVQHMYDLFGGYGGGGGQIKTANDRKAPGKK